MHFLRHALPEFDGEADLTGTLIIGIGNRFRGDDALGCILADQLKEHGFNAMEHSGEPASLMDAWQGYDPVILIDCVFSGAAPGTIHHFDLQQDKLPADFAKPTTHAVGIAEAVEFARVLGKLPPHIEFYGVEGAAYESGESLTPAVKKAAEELKEKILTTEITENTERSQS